MKVGVVSLLQVLVLVLGFCVRSSSLASFGDQQRNRRKSVLPTEASSSLVLNRVGSSIAFPVHGNVYPIGCVYKPYTIS